MRRLVLFFGIVLLPQACSLRCYACVPGSSGPCTVTTTECPEQEFQCSALRITSYADGSKTADVSGKHCSPVDQCGEMSVNFGVSRTFFVTKCCDTDLCNSGTATDALDSIPNGKKCFQCDGNQCSTMLNCQGNEDYCISATVDSEGKRTTMKGCASKQMCFGAKVEGVIAAKINCCEGDFCNSAHSMATGLFLVLLAPLLLLVLFS